MLSHKSAKLLLLLISSSVSTKTVMLLGQTGAGKSFIGNAMLQKKHFRVTAGNGNSITEELQKGTSSVKIGTGTMSFTVWDTPGLGDTYGRSKEFLDTIMQQVKRIQLDAIVLVVSDQRYTLEFKVGLRALKECFGAALLPHRVILVANKMTTPFQLENQDPPIEDEKEQQHLISNLTQQRRKDISGFMGLKLDSDEELQSVIPNSAEKKDGIPFLLEVINKLPSQAWNLQHVKTFTEVKQDANSALTDAESLSRQADESELAMRTRIQELHAHIDSNDKWREGAQKVRKTIGDTTKAFVDVGVAAVGTLDMAGISLPHISNPFLGQVCAIGTTACLTMLNPMGLVTAGVTIAVLAVYGSASVVE